MKNGGLQGAITGTDYIVKKKNVASFLKASRLKASPEEGTQMCSLESAAAWMAPGPPDSCEAAFSVPSVARVPSAP